MKSLKLTLLILCLALVVGVSYSTLQETEDREDRIVSPLHVPLSFRQIASKRTDGVAKEEGRGVGIPKEEEVETSVGIAKEEQEEKRRRAEEEDEDEDVPGDTFLGYMEASGLHGNLTTILHERMPPMFNLFQPPISSFSSSSSSSSSASSSFSSSSNKGDSKALTDLVPIWKAIKPYYLPIQGTFNNSECEMDVKDINLLKPRKPFLKMIDSWGKLADGFLFGNVRAKGMFQECVRVEAQYNLTTIFPPSRTLRSYTGRYCSVFYAPEGDGGSERSGVAFAVLANPLPFSYATCIPSTCTIDDLRSSLNVTLASKGIKIVNVVCHAEEDPPMEMVAEDRAMLSIIGIFGILVVLATIQDIALPLLNKSPWKVVSVWSLPSNLRRIFTYDDPSPGTSITCLGAMRVLTMTWIIICHQYETNAKGMANSFDSLSYQDPVITQVVTNGWLAVDTFLFMTGLVLTYRLYPHLNAQGPIVISFVHNTNILAKTFLRRFLRLAPSIFCVALFSASLLRFISYGPEAHTLQQFTEEVCRPNWWKDPLFINNYVFGPHEENEIPDCLDHCWYTAVDMQLLLFLLPAILLPGVYHKFIGVGVLTTATLGSVIVPMALTLAYDLPPSPLHWLSSDKHYEYMWRIFLTPWCRAGPWLVGIWTALFLRDVTLRKIKLRKWVIVFGYIAAISLGLVLVLGLYPYNHVFPDRDWKENPAVGAIYGSLARPSWAVCLAWVVITCHTGNADSVNRLLSYPGWRPLARLTFTMYLIAPVVQLWWTSVQFVPTYYNYLGKLFESLGVTFIAGLFAIILSCLIELPINASVDLLMPSPAKKLEAEREVENERLKSFKIHH